jgi:hypothetical protein
VMSCLDFESIMLAIWNFHCPLIHQHAKHPFVGEPHGFESVKADHWSVLRDLPVGLGQETLGWWLECWLATVHWGDICMLWASRKLLRTGWGVYLPFIVSLPSFGVAYSKNLELSMVRVNMQAGPEGRVNFLGGRTCVLFWTVTCTNLTHQHCVCLP